MDTIKEEFYDAIFQHKEPPCPKCKTGRIICPNGKIDKPHYFRCSNDCGWYMNIDYCDCIVE